MVSLETALTTSSPLATTTRSTSPRSRHVELDSLLDRYVSKDAFCTSFYSPPECHPNTRTTIRNEIGRWIDESGSKESPLLWLNGPAGVGKSVIAKTVSVYHNQVVATFFFSTSIDRSAATIFPTLAWQLARRIPETRKHVIASLKNRNSLQTSQLEAQFNLLIVQPLMKITTTLKYRPIMVIDGVDESTDEHMLARFLRVLVQAGKRGSELPVRFIICSRPEPWIHAILGRGTSDGNPTTNGQESQSPRRSVASIGSIGLFGLHLAFSTALIALIAIHIIQLTGLMRFIGFDGLMQLFGLFGLVRIVQLLRLKALKALIKAITLLASFGLTGLITSIAITGRAPVASSSESLRTITNLIVLLAPLPSYSPSSEVHLLTPIQRSRGFLEEVWELYKPIRLGVDKGGPLLSSDPEGPQTRSIESAVT